MKKSYMSLELWAATDAEQQDFENDIKDIIKQHNGDITEMGWEWDNERELLDYHICLDQYPDGDKMISDIERNCENPPKDRKYVCRFNFLEKDELGLCP